MAATPLTPTFPLVRDHSVTSEGAPTAPKCTLPDNSPSLMTLGPATFCQLVFTSMPAALACFSIRPSRSISISGRNDTPNCCAMVISDSSARETVALASNSPAARMALTFIPSSGSRRKLEQFQRIGAAELAPILFAQRQRVKPVCRIADILKRIVRRPQHTLQPDLGDRLVKRRGREVARGGQHEVFAEIVAHPFLGRVGMARLHPVVAMIDAPEVGRDAFTEMTEDDLE